MPTAPGVASTAPSADMSQHADVLPDWLVADLRSDHAGETGAVMIYRGILAVSRDTAVRDFAERHLQTERDHLEQISAVLPQAKRTRLLPVWRLMGWLTGALPALFGANAVFGTIEAVETFVDVHYQQQIDKLEGLDRYRDLRALLVSCQEDEVSHRDEAAANRLRAPSWPLRTWQWLVGAGSASAVWLAKRI